MTDKLTVLIDSAEQHPGIPPLGQAVSCELKECPGPGGWALSFGLAGGGYGTYEYCDVCGRVVAKDQEEE